MYFISCAAWGIFMASAETETETISNGSTSIYKKCV